MPFEIPTFEETQQLGIDLARRMLPDDDTSEGSWLARVIGVQAGLVTDNHVHIATAVEEILPDKAVGAGQDRWGGIKGAIRKAATPARKANALRLTGTPGSPFSVGDELSHESTLLFKINESGTIPAAGYVDVDVVGINTGSLTRLAARQTLSFTTPLVGIAPDAELQLALDEDGDDAEQDGAYLLRILNRFSNPPLGGATNDYRQWALEVLGVATAHAYPLRGGHGTMDVAALHAGSGTSRILSAGERTELATYINGKRPVTVLEFRVLEVDAQTVDVEIGVKPLGAKYAFDWTDQTPPVVAAWNAGTRTLTLAAPRPDTMTAGGRIVLRTAGGTGVPIAIESLPVTTTDLVLESEPSVPPLAGDLVHAGGPLTVPGRAAVQALFDAIGTANPDDRRYDEWEGNLRVLDLGEVIKSVTGVYNPEVVEPAVDVEADDPVDEFPNDARVSLLVARRILILRRW